LLGGQGTSVGAFLLELAVDGLATALLVAATLVVVLATRGLAFVATLRSLLGRALTAGTVVLAGLTTARVLIVTAFALVTATASAGISTAVCLVSAATLVVVVSRLALTLGAIVISGLLLSVSVVVSAVFLVLVVCVAGRTALTGWLLLLLFRFLVGGLLAWGLLVVAIAGRSSGAGSARTAALLTTLLGRLASLLLGLVITCRGRRGGIFGLICVIVAWLLLSLLALAARLLLLSTLGLSAGAARLFLGIVAALVPATSVGVLTTGGLDIEPLAVGLNFTLGDGRLVANILGVESLLAELDLKHSDDSGELEVVEAFLKGLVLVEDRDVRDLVDLVQAGNTVLDQLSQLHSGLHGVRDALDYDAVAALSTEQVVCPLEVPADADFALDADFVGGQHLLALFNATIFVCHLLSKFLLNY
jgi:hypothetical protein